MGFIDVINGSMLPRAGNHRTFWRLPSFVDTAAAQMENARCLLRKETPNHHRIMPMTLHLRRPRLAACRPTNMDGHWMTIRKRRPCRIVSCCYRASQHATWLCRHIHRLDRDGSPTFFPEYHTGTVLKGWSSHHITKMSLQGVNQS